MRNIEILLILCILLGFINWMIFYQNYLYLKNLKSSNNIYQENDNKQPIYTINQENIIKQPVYTNIIEPPERVYTPKNIIFPQIIDVPKTNFTINYPTRGYPEQYQLIGYLINETGDNAYNIYGRQKYPGSELYEYFIHAIINNNNIKIPLNINKEIYDNQKIHILKHNYKAKLYPYQLKYLP